MAEFGGEFFFCGCDECIVYIFLDEVNGAAAEAAAHHTRTRHAAFLGNVVEVIQLLAAHLVKLAHAVVGAVHALANGLIITFFQGVAHVEDTLLLTDDIFRAHVVLSGNLHIDLVEHGHRGIAQIFHFGMLLGDVGTGVLARLSATVVGRGSQLMLNNGIEQYDLVALRVEWEVFKLHRGAVKAHQVAFLAEEGSKLVHDAAFHANIVVLRGLTNAGQLELVDAQIE